MGQIVKHVTRPCTNATCLAYMIFIILQNRFSEQCGLHRENQRTKLRHAVECSRVWAGRLAWATPRLRSASHHRALHGRRRRSPGLRRRRPAQPAPVAVPHLLPPLHLLSSISLPLTLVLRRAGWLAGQIWPPWARSGLHLLGSATNSGCGHGFDIPVPGYATSVGWPAGRAVLAACTLTTAGLAAGATMPCRGPPLVAGRICTPRA